MIVDEGYISTPYSPCRAACIAIEGSRVKKCAKYPPSCPT